MIGNDIKNVITVKCFGTRLEFVRALQLQSHFSSLGGNTGLCARQLDPPPPPTLI